MILIYAYAYEVMSESLVDDATFDRRCLEIDLSIDTGNAEMDAWFRKHFDPCTGQWVRSLPRKETIKLHSAYEKYFKKKG